VNPDKKLTVRTIQQLYRDGTNIVALAVYDALMGRLADEEDVHMVLVGDSMGMTVLGYDNTLPVTLAQSLHHTAAVVRGVKRALVIGDMPFLSFQINPDEALRNAGRYLQEAGADGVKLEGGRTVAGTVSRLADCGIPVVGHIGILPQRVKAEGGYRVQGKSKNAAESLCDDALALQEAGAFSIILEGIPAALAKHITETLDVPTIGIGAGPDCNGQIQVAHDILGLFEDWAPKHSKQYANLAHDVRSVFKQFADDVQNKRFPGKEQSY
jgi:3-methyl-2-oxobutanoate hydroxymethyltransferase